LWEAALKLDPKFFEGTGISPEALLRFHPEANRFPLMDNKEFNPLVDDIKKNGLQKPITLYEESILDGRNRYLACREAGVEPKFEQYEGKDPVTFVYSANVHRRHLSREQKQDLVCKLLAEFPERSDREIADMAQVHHKTVGRIRAGLEERGAMRHVESRVDTKGRSYPSHKGRKARFAPVSLIGPDDAEPESLALACAGGLRHGDANRNVNALLNILSAEKKRIAAIPKPSRAALARRFLEVVDIAFEDLRPIDGVPDFKDGFSIGVHTEIKDHPEISAEQP
jgi:hypothetical protein